MRKDIIQPGSWEDIKRLLILSSNWIVKDSFLCIILIVDNMALIHCQYSRLRPVLKFVTACLIFTAILCFIYPNYRNNGEQHDLQPSQRFPRFVPDRKDLQRGSPQHLRRQNAHGREDQEEEELDNNEEKYIYNYGIKPDTRGSRQERFQPKKQNRENGVYMDHYKNEEIEIPKVLRDELWPPKTTKKRYHREFIETTTKAYDVQDDPSSIYIASATPIGSQLFQFASVYGIAKDTNREAFMDPLFTLPQIFNIDVKTKVMPPGVVMYHEDSPGFYSRELAKKTGDMGVCCYLQSWRYFGKHIKAIRQQLQFIPKISQAAEVIVQAQKDAFIEDLMKQLKNENDVLNELPGSHKRLQDYAQKYNPETQTFRRLHITKVGLHVHRPHGSRKAKTSYDETLPTVPKEYFEKAMQTFRDDQSDMLFFVVTDDIAWCKENLNFTSSDIVFVGENTPEVDLAILASMDRVITSLGPFSWWGGFLSGGRVAYYQNWIKETLETRTPYRTKHYYPPWWIPISI